MDEERYHWVKRILGINGHEEEPEAPMGQGFAGIDKAIATALVWCVATLLILRFRNPELGLVLGAVAAGVTVFIWKKKGGA